MGTHFWLLAVCLAVGTALPAVAGDTPHGFLNKVHKSPDGERKYVVFVPHDYTGAKEIPLILFLHGAGERGDDGQAPVMQGIANAIKFKNGEKKFPCIVVFPQCKAGSNWQADSADGKRALSILDEVLKEYKVDTKRMYLTGLSMGGYGTWSFAAAQPDRWAAIVPICGGGDPKVAPTIKDIPCWCFHGAEDKAVLVNRSRAMIEALKAAGGSPRYTEMPYVGHNSWDPAYVTTELVPWLLAQRCK